MSRRDSTENAVNEPRSAAKTDTPVTRGVQPPFFELKTNQGPIFVDEADAEIVLPFNWYAVPSHKGGRFYAHARVPKADGKRIIMHRVLMNAPACLVVHHRNNNGMDNRRSNLEITTTRKNIRYAFEGRSTGVHFDPIRQKWRVQLRASLGFYKDEEVAREVARQAQEKMEEWLAQIEGAAK